MSLLIDNMIVIFLKFKIKTFFNVRYLYEKFNIFL